MAQCAGSGFESRGGTETFWACAGIVYEYTINTAAFYKYNNYEFKFSIYNLTDRRNLVNDIPFYGNDFITVNPPRSFGISIKARFFG